MALLRGKLADIQYISNTTGSIYANPATTKSYIRGLIIFNNNTATEQVELHNVPDSGGALGTASAANRFWYAGLAAKETVFIEFPHPIVLTDTNDAIFAKSASASQVTVMVLGDRDP